MAYGSAWSEMSLSSLMDQSDQILEKEVVNEESRTENDSFNISEKEPFFIEIGNFSNKHLFHFASRIRRPFLSTIS